MPWIDHLPLAAGGSGVTPFFGMLAMVLVLAVFVSLALVKLRQSLLVGYFLCGVLIANSGVLVLVGIGPQDPTIANLGELGVILLMFTLGLEFSVEEFRHLWRLALFGGGLQVALTAVVVVAVSRLAGLPWPETIVLSVAVALSSTAVAMKSFQELGQPNNPGARFSLGVALFQDLLVILFMLLLPAIYGRDSGSTVGHIAWAMGKGVLFLGAAILLGRYGNTPLLHAVARTRSRDSAEMRLTFVVRVFHRLLLDDRAEGILIGLGRRGVEGCAG